MVACATNSDTASKINAPITVAVPGFVTSGYVNVVVPVDVIVYVPLYPAGVIPEITPLVTVPDGMPCGVVVVIVTTLVSHVAVAIVSDAVSDAVKSDA